MQDVLGTPDLHMTLVCGPLDAVTAGQQPMHDGEHLERNAGW